MPFISTLQRDLHFAKHGRHFGVADATQYETMADAFMSGAMSIATQECVRRNMTERLRFNYMNRHLGVANVKPEYLKTFYAVSLHTVQYHGGSAGYFNYECDRTDL